jgi:hypothetical protein
VLVEPRSIRYEGTRSVAARFRLGEVEPTVLSECVG